MDFTLSKYRSLLTALKRGGYESILPGQESITEKEGRAVILRHDVDRRPDRSLKTARIEAEIGYKAVYYFRAVPCSWNEGIIRKIAAMGHEIGYHYECLTTSRGDIDAAWEDFRINLEQLRKLAPVTSACMHGSPRSNWDSKDIWRKYDYRTAGVTFEPYIDTDFHRVFYLTDTGRRWDGWKVSVRDKIEDRQDAWCADGLVFHSTDDVMEGINKTYFPEHLMITTHPQRWTDSPVGWINEAVAQPVKNIVKKLLIRDRRQDICR